MDYTLSAWVKSQSETSVIYLGLLYYDSAYSPLSPAYQYMAASAYSPVPGDGWHIVEGICYNSSSGETNHFPAGTDYVKIRCYPQYQSVGGSMIGRIAFHEGHYAQRSITVIDGGNIYTDTITADQINGGSFGTLTISSGKINLDTSDAVVVKDGADIILEEGGDIRLTGSSTSNPAELQIYNTGGSVMTSSLGSDSSAHSYWRPAVDTTDTIYLGQLIKRFDEIWMFTSTRTGISAYTSTDDSAEILLETGTATDANHLTITIEDGGDTGGITVINDSLYPINTMDLGTDSDRWANVYSDLLDIKSDPGAGSSYWIAAIENENTSDPHGLYIYNSAYTGANGFFFHCSRGTGGGYTERMYIEGDGDCYNKNNVWGDIDSARSLKENIIDCTPKLDDLLKCCLLYTSPSPRDGLLSRMPSSA